MFAQVYHHPIDSFISSASGLTLHNELTFELRLWCQMDLMTSFKHLIHCCSMQLSRLWLEWNSQSPLSAICAENIFATITSSCRTFSCSPFHAIRSLQISHANTRHTLRILISIDLIFTLASHSMQFSFEAENLQFSSFLTHPSSFTYFSHSPLTCSPSAAP